jgi:hypothetical protein
MTAMNKLHFEQRKSASMRETLLTAAEEVGSNTIIVSL